MSTRTWPSPAQASQRPPGTLNEKSAGGEPAAARVAGGREQLADAVERLQVGDGVGARRAPDRRLVDQHDVVHVGRALDGVVLPHRPVPAARARAAGPRRARRAPASTCRSPETPVTQVKAPSGMRDVDALQVVGARAPHRERQAVALAPRAGHRDLQLAAQVLAGQAAAVAQQLRVAALEDHAAALLARARARGRSTWSATSMIARSCSTTSTVLPWSRSAFRMSIRRSVSRGCRPIDGSSSTYSVPTQPACRARPPARCAAPRRRRGVPNGRSSVR